MKEVALKLAKVMGSACVVLAFSPSNGQCSEAASVDEALGASETVEARSVEEQAMQKIIELEAEIIKIKRSLGMDRQSNKQDSTSKNWGLCSR